MDDQLRKALRLLVNKLRAPDPVPTPEVKKRDVWDKAAVVSGFLSSVVIAIVGLVVTSSLQRSQQASAQALATAQLELGRINAERDRKLQESRFTADLLNHLLSKDSAHRQIAIIALRETVSANVSDSVLAVLAQRDSDSSVRVTAIQQLSSSSDRGVARQMNSIASDVNRPDAERTLARQVTGSIAYNSAAGHNMLIGAATGRSSAALESTELRHGIFTSALLDGLSGLADIHNDKRITVDALSSFVRSRTVELSRGQMHPTFFNSIESGDDTVLPRPGRIVWLSIGIDRYRYASPNLPSFMFACSDAQAFSQVLVAKWGQSQTNGVILCNERATRAAILDRFSRLGSDVDSGTSVFIYLAGHGFTQDGTAFIVPYDGVPSEGARPVDNALSLNDLRRSLEKLNAARVFWFIDSAYSGAALQDAR